MWVSMNHSRLAVCLSSFVALAAFACSSAPVETGGADKPSTKAPAGSKNTDKETSTDTDKTDTEPSKPLSDTAACGQKATAQACGACCLEKTPEALDASDKVYGDCVCAPTACGTECAASYCSEKENQNEPTAACNTCLDAKEPACGDKADAVCNADPACKAADACLVTSCKPLADKEQAAAGGGMKSLNLRAAKAASRRR
jgi:hypothetical protein